MKPAHAYATMSSFHRSAETTEVAVGFMRKSMKDMKTMVGAAPGMIEQANQLAAQAQQMQQAQAAQAAQMQAMQAGPTIPAGDPRLAPIAGITLEQYAAISKVAATQGADEGGLVRLALARGAESAEAWQEAYEGWNGRMQGDMQLATHFGHLYQAAS